MSSPAASSQSPDPASSSISNNDQRNNAGASSNLYLVTFLATLFLLLFVSCAIVLRSYMLRRRYQRRLDEAMAAGMLLAPRTQGSKRKRLGAKPALFDTCLAHGGVTWEHIKPLSAQPIFVKRKYKDGRVPKDGVIISGPTLPGGHDPNNPSSSLSPNGSPNTSPATSRSLPRRLLAFPRTWWPSSSARNPPTPNEPDLPDDMEVALIEQDCPATSDVPSSPGGLVPPSSSTNPPTTPSTAIAMPGATYKVRVEMLQVSVLIAMPSPNRTTRKHKNLYHPSRSEEDDDDDDDDEDEDEDEENLPELVFGVTRVNYRQPKASSALALAASNPEQKHELLVSSSVPSSPVAVTVPHEVL